MDADFGAGIIDPVGDVEEGTNVGMFSSEGDNAENLFKLGGVGMNEGESKLCLLALRGADLALIAALNAFANDAFDCCCC